jgi:zona occludens toxin
MKEAAEKGRPLFQSGIPDLKLPFIPVPPIAEWTEMRPDPDNPGMEAPYFTFPENSLIVLDEAQRIYRVRANGAQVPVHVAAFETVRHTGVTFLLMTQNPTFLDTHIRKLVGQHIHLRDVGLLGRWYYEWPECSDVERFATAPIKKKWSLPKESFPLYKSASMHIKRQYSVPPVMVLFGVCMLLVVYGAWRVYSSIDAKVSPVKVEAKQSGEQVVPVQPVAPGPVVVRDGGAYLASFTPLVPGRPETAPAYDGLRQVKVMPRIAGGMCTPERCVCYTQQGTNAGLDDGQCRAWLANPPFDPYRDPEPVAEPVISPSPAVLHPVVDNVKPAPKG